MINERMYFLDKAARAFTEYLDEDGALPASKDFNGHILIQTDSWFNLTRALDEALRAADKEREVWKSAE